VETLGDMGGLSRVGQFDGEAGLDLVAPTSYRIDFFPNLEVESPAAWTVVSDVHGMDVADTNLDGIDDLLLTRQNGERVQLWLGRGDGLFEVSHEFEAHSGTAAKFARLVPDRLDVVLAGGADLVQYVQGEAGAFVEAARTPGHSSGTLAVANSPTGDWVATSWWWAELDTYSGAAVFTFPELGEAVALGYGLSPEPTGAVAASDVDGDGVPELFVEVGNADGRTSHLDVACKSGDALLLCGRTDLPGMSGRLEIVERGGQSYVVYSSTAAGTTVAAVEVDRCP
jgi:hypothetical protein